MIFPTRHWPSRLTLLYELAQKRGVPFDYYSAVVRDGTSYAMNPVYDVPADVVKDADALAQYLADEPRISMEQGAGKCRVERKTE